MSRILALLLLVGLATTFTCDAAKAEEPADEGVELPCSGYEQIRRELDEQYAEEPVSLGLQSNGHLLQVFASEESGTWTIISMAPNGTACVVAAGANWETLAPKRDETLVGSDGA
jgi:hypothetical protein